MLECVHSLETHKNSKIPYTFTATAPYSKVLTSSNSMVICETDKSYLLDKTGSINGREYVEFHDDHYVCQKACCGGGGRHENNL